MRPICWFDVETTGLSIKDDRIIEICIIKTLNDIKVDTFYSFINPDGIKSSENAFEKHGITDESLLEYPTFKDIAHKIKDFIEDCDLGGYNCMGFDIPILVESFLREGILLNLKNIQFIDPLDQWRKNEERKLENAYKYFCDKTIENAHSALYDIEATIEIYKAQKEKYELNETNINSRDFIFLDLNKKIKKIDNDLFFTFGKYKDTSVRNVYKNDKNYLAWMLSENSDFSLDTKMWIKRIIEKLNSIEN